MLIHLKLQIFFVLSGLDQYDPKFSEIPLKFNEFEFVLYNHVYCVTEYDSFKAFFRNSENKEIFCQNFTCQGISYFMLQIREQIHCFKYSTLFNINVLLTEIYTFNPILCFLAVHFYFVQIDCHNCVM